MTTKTHTLRLEIPGLHEKSEGWLPISIHDWAERWGWTANLRIRNTATAIEIEGEPLDITADQWRDSWDIILRADAWTERRQYGIRLTPLGKKNTITVKTWVADGLDQVEHTAVCTEVPFEPAFGYGWDWQPLPLPKTDGPTWLTAPRHGQREKPWERLDQAISPLVLAKALDYATFRFPDEGETIIFDADGRYAGVVRQGEWLETSGLAEELEEAEERLETVRQHARAARKSEHELFYPRADPLDEDDLWRAGHIATRDEREAVEKLKARIAENNYAMDVFVPTPSGARAFLLEREDRAVGTHEMLTATIGGDRSLAAKLAARYRDDYQSVVAWMYSQRNKPQPAIEAAAVKLIALPRPKKNNRTKKSTLTGLTGADLETFRTILAACGGDEVQAMKVIATIAKEMNR